MSIPDTVLQFARERHYDGAEESTPWNGYTVYIPLYDLNTGECIWVGPPLVILVKDEKIRLSTVDESFEYLHYEKRKND